MLRCNAAIACVPQMSTRSAATPFPMLAMGTAKSVTKNSETPTPANIRTHATPQDISGTLRMEKKSRTWYGAKQYVWCPQFVRLDSQENRLSVHVQQETKKTLRDKAKKRFAGGQNKVLGEAVSCPTDADPTGQGKCIKVIAITPMSTVMVDEFDPTQRRFYLRLSPLSYVNKEKKTNDANTTASFGHGLTYHFEATSQADRKRWIQGLRQCSFDGLCAERRPIESHTTKDRVSGGKARRKRQPPKRYQRANLKEAARGNESIPVVHDTGMTAPQQESDMGLNTVPPLPKKPTMDAAEEELHASEGAKSKPLGLSALTDIPQQVLDMFTMLNAAPPLPKKPAMGAAEEQVHSSEGAKSKTLEVSDMSSMLTAVPPLPKKPTLGAAEEKVHSSEGAKSKTLEVSDMSTTLKAVPPLPKKPTLGSMERQEDVSEVPKSKPQGQYTANCLPQNDMSIPASTSVPPLPRKPTLNATENVYISDACMPNKLTKNVGKQGPSMFTDLPAVPKEPLGLMQPLSQADANTKHCRRMLPVPPVPTKPMPTGHLQSTPSPSQPCSLKPPISKAQALDEHASGPIASKKQPLKQWVIGTDEHAGPVENQRTKSFGLVYERKPMEKFLTQPDGTTQCFKEIRMRGVSSDF